MGILDGMGKRLRLGKDTGEKRTDMSRLNEPCWCGSGKTYKKCHLYEDYKKVTNKVPLNEHG